MKEAADERNARIFTPAQGLLYWLAGFSSPIKAISVFSFFLVLALMFANENWAAGLLPFAGFAMALLVAGAVSHPIKRRNRFRDRDVHAICEGTVFLVNHDNPDIQFYVCDMLQRIPGQVGFYCLRGGCSGLQSIPREPGWQNAIIERICELRFGTPSGHEKLALAESFMRHGGIDKHVHGGLYNMNFSSSAK